MTNRIAIFVVALLLAVTTAAAAELRTIKIAFVDRSADPFYARRTSYGGTYDATRQPALAGAQLGVKDAKVIGRATGAAFQLFHLTIAKDGGAAAAVRDLIQRENPVAIILDLPQSDLETVAAAVGSGSAALFNIRHRGDALRATTCRSNVFHVIPSAAMLHDALAQFIVSAGWTGVLLLASGSPADLAQSQSFQAAARKFGLSISDVRQFVHGSDPRQRDQNNVRLLTGGANYDVVFVADETGDFARLLQFRTVSPRPIIGAAGLIPLAWHPRWERNGAPQLSRRFLKFAGRTMTEEDWAAWVAVKAIVTATARTNGPLVAELLNPDLTLELYKGYPGSFRPWDRQLRQSILLATSDTVIALAPVEGALHQFNNLDTLGLDEPEFHCP